MARSNGFCIYFAEGDLLEGLRVIRERPIFDSRNLNNIPYRFQKQNGQVMVQGPDGLWRDTDMWSLQKASDSQLHAFMKARAS